MNALTAYNPKIKPPLGVLLDKGDPINRGLAGRWIMNEGAGNKVQDISGNGNTGTFANGPVWEKTLSGHAVNFTRASNQYIHVGDKASLEGMSQLTLRAVFRMSPTAVDGVHVICSKFDGRHAYKASYSMAYMITEGDFWRIYICAYVPEATAWDIYSDWAYDPSHRTKWRDLLFVSNGQTAAIYLDGKEFVSPKSRIGGIQSVECDFAIGTNLSGTPDWSMDGTVSYVEVWNRALSASEIARLYRDPYAGIARSRIELWSAAGVTPPTFKPHWAIRRSRTVGAGVL